MCDPHQACSKHFGGLYRSQAWITGNHGQAVVTWSLSGVCPRHSISSAAAPGPASLASGTSLTKSSSISLSLMMHPRSTVTTRTAEQTARMQGSSRRTTSDVRHHGRWPELLPIAPCYNGRAAAQQRMQNLCYCAHLSDARSNISTASTFVSFRRAAAPAHAECTSGKMTKADFYSRTGANHMSARHI